MGGHWKKLRGFLNDGVVGEIIRGVWAELLPGVGAWQALGCFCALEGGRRKKLGSGVQNAPIGVLT